MGQFRAPRAPSGYVVDESTNVAGEVPRILEAALFPGAAYLARTVITCICSRALTQQYWQPYPSFIPPKIG